MRFKWYAGLLPPYLWFTTFHLTPPIPYTQKQSSLCQTHLQPNFHRTSWHFRTLWSQNRTSSLFPLSYNSASLHFIFMQGHLTNNALTSSLNQKLLLPFNNKRNPQATTVWTDTVWILFYFIFFTVSYKTKQNKKTDFFFLIFRSLIYKKKKKKDI